jgi:MFS family permease
VTRRAALWTAARADWSTAGGCGRALVIAAWCILAYEWSAGNETLTTLLITGLLRHHHSVPGVLVAGTLAALLLFVEQLLSGHVFLGAVDRLPSLTELLDRAVHARFADGVPRYMALPIVTRVGISFVMGTSFVVVEDTLAGEPHRPRSIAISAATTGLVVFAITGVIGGALIAAAGTPLEGPVKVVYAIAGDWRFWLGILVIPPLLRALVRRVRLALERRKRAHAAPELGSR